MKAWAFLLIPLSLNAQADVTLSVGLGKNALSSESKPFERAAALGYQFNLAHDVFLRPEAGYFEDISGHGDSSFWAAPIIGAQSLAPSGTEFHVGIGPGWLQNPDSVLGGHFQFSLEGGAGITDGHTYIGLAWKHLSSAGLEQPNMGRDFITVQLRIR